MREVGPEEGRSIIVKFCMVAPLRRSESQTSYQFAHFIFHFIIHNNFSMSDNHSMDYVSKIVKLAGQDNFIHWRRCVLSYIERSDMDFLCFTEKPNGRSATEDKVTEWRQANSKARSSIVMTLDKGPMAQVGHIIDDRSKTAKDLWDALEKLYTTSNTQTIINLNQALNSMRFKDEGDWEKHIQKFHNILGKLASYDSAIDESTKVSKLINTLPESFSAIAIVSSTTDMTLDKTINAVVAELDRRKNRNVVKGDVVKPSVSYVQKNMKTNSGKSDMKRKKNSKGGPCFVCGRIGHFARECWHRQAQPTARGRGTRGGRFHRGGRGGRGRGWTQSPQRYGYEGPRYQGHPQENGRAFMNDVPPPQYEAHQANASHHVGNPRANNQYQQPDDSTHKPYGFMAKLKFRSSSAAFGDRKSNVCLIDSGASDHFFFSRSSFLTYEEMESKTVQAAAGNSIIVGKGQVKLPLDGGVLATAYHTPHFSTNILSVGKLSGVYDTLFTTKKNTRGSSPVCEVSRKSDGLVIHTIPQKDGLYSISQPGAQDSTNVNQEDVNDILANCEICNSAIHKNSLNGMSDEALRWHTKLGHPSPARYMKASERYDDVPYFSRDILNNILCVPCRLGKAKRAPILPSSRVVQRPLELVHMDISGKLMESAGSNSYVLGIVDDFTAKSDVFFIQNRSSFLDCLKFYKEYSEKVVNHPLTNIRLDGAGENSTEEVKMFCIRNGIKLEYSPRYAPESNGVAERFMQELGLRARVMLLSSEMDKEMWGEAMNHGNWLRNRLPSERIGGNIPILEWNPYTRVSFENIPKFGESGFAFVYRSSTAKGKKLLPRAIHGQFVGMESECSLFRIYISSMKRILKVRANDFKICSQTQLPGVSALLDGISRQMNIEDELCQEGIAEEILAQAFQCFRVPLREIICNSARRNRKDPRLPKNFDDAIRFKDWRTAIDRELNGLLKQETWRYVERTDAMSPIPITWDFRLKPINREGTVFLHKARCVVRGDLQVAGIDFDPEKLYAPVASHAAIHALIAIAAERKLLIEGADISHAYLHGRIDIPIIIEQPRSSDGKELKPGMVCELLKCMYGLKQAGSIWGCLLIVQLISWGFIRIYSDQRVLVKVVGIEFVIMAIVVDDMIFISNSANLLDYLKKKLSSTFDVKLFGRPDHFIGWELHHDDRGITISQQRYVLDLLEKHNLHNANGVFTPLPTDGNFSLRAPNDVPLPPRRHSRFRAAVGELLYLSVCTRPDISFAVSVLARCVHAPTVRHELFLKRIFRYLAGSPSLGIKYRVGEEVSAILEAFSDADWAGCRESRKSTSGFLINYHGSPVVWKSSKQTIVALSSAEAEYVALSTCGKELVWVRRLFSEIFKSISPTATFDIETTPVFVDSTAVIGISSNPQIRSKSKHICVKYHHIRDLLENRVIRLVYIPTSDMLADILTKAASRKVMDTLLPLLLSSSQ